MGEAQVEAQVGHLPWAAQVDLDRVPEVLVLAQVVPVLAQAVHQWEDQADLALALAVLVQVPEALRWAAQVDLALAQAVLDQALVGLVLALVALLVDLSVEKGVLWTNSVEVLVVPVQALEDLVQAPGVLVQALEVPAPALAALRHSGDRLR